MRKIMWPPDEFLSYLQDKVDLLVASGTVANDHDGFLWWTLTNFFELPDLAARKAIVFSGKGDSQIDALWGDDKKLRIIQAKTSDPLTDYDTFDSQAAKDLVQALHVLRNPGTIKDSQTKLAAAEYEEAKRQRKTIEFIALISGQAGKPLEEAIDRLNAEFRDHGAEGHGHFARVVQLKDLNAKFVQSLEGQSVPPVEIPILRTGIDQGYHYLDDAKSAVIMDLSAATIAGWVHDHSYAIVGKNLRYPLFTKFNESILATLKDADERKNFWYYNNGLTIVCDEVRLIPGDNPGPKLWLKAPQIVNGCQTAFTFNRFLEENAKDPKKLEEARKVLEQIRVLARIIPTNAHPGGPDSVRIAQYTNSQNPITERDLQSNDPVQVLLQRSFAEKGYFYERKNGEWVAVRGPGPRAKGGFQKGKLDNQDLAQAALVFWLQKPQEAKNESKMIFNRSKVGYYSSIFKPDTPSLISADELLLPYLIQHVHEAWFDDWNHKHPVTRTSHPLSIQRAEIVRHSDFYMLALTSRILTRKYGIKYLQGQGAEGRIRVSELLDRVTLSISRGSRPDSLQKGLRRQWDRMLVGFNRYVQGQIGKDPTLNPRKVFVRRSTYTDPVFLRVFSEAWEKAAAKDLPDL